MRAINEEKTKELMQELLPDDPQETLKILEEFDVLMMRYDSAIREVRTKLRFSMTSYLCWQNRAQFLRYRQEEKNRSAFWKN